MKKLFFPVIAFILIANTATAQDAAPKSATKFNIAANVGTGTKEGYKMTYGADVQAEFPATTGLKITASAGYQNFNYKFTVGNSTIKDDFSFIPLLAGAKFNLGSKFYGHAQLGYALSTVSGGGGHFSFAPSIGYWLSQKFDISLKYLSIDQLNAVLLRLALGL